MTVTVHRGAERFRTEQPGITTRHAFSSGAHYDPGNVAFGPVVACDEHMVDPGAGFTTHKHARVELVSWVLEGRLRHSGAGTGEHVVAAGQAQYQLAGLGIEHAEVNDSATEPLHFLQLWLRTDEEVPDYDLGRPPLRTSSGVVDVWTRADDEPLPGGALHLVMAAVGEWTVGGHRLRAGDHLRATGERLTATGSGQLLVVAVTAG